MSQPQKSQGVLYIDGFGRTHTAIVTAVNAAHQGYITLVYVDVNAPEPDNVKKVFDVPHVDDPSRAEPNPDLPSYEVNCWKFVGEVHSPLPSDHPAFDHPFEPKKVDEQGNVIPKERPETEADLADHKRWPNSRFVVEENTATPPPAPAEMSLPSWAGVEHTVERIRAFLVSKGYLIQDLADIIKFMHGLAAHQAKALREDFAKWAEQNPAPTSLPLPGGAESNVTIETKQYTDGSSATGPAPLPDQSPDQQAKQAATEAEPSAADLDAAAAEQKAKEATSGTIAGKAAETGCANVEGGIMCGEPLSAHTPEAARMDVGMDHPFVPGTFDPTVPINDPPPPPAPPAEEGQTE